MRWWFCCLLALALTGCAVTAPEKKRDVQADEQRPPLDTDGVVEHEVDSQAVAMLWDKAEAALQDNRLDDAVAALERAIRLAPDDAVLWSRLAELRLRQRDYAVAENLAAKSNALAGDRRLLRYRNWLLIMEARRRRGDEVGARKAQERARALRTGSGAIGPQSSLMPEPPRVALAE